MDAKNFRQGVPSEERMDEASLPATAARDGRMDAKRE